MAQWLSRLESELGGAYAFFAWVGIVTVAVLALLALVRLIRLFTGVSLLGFPSGKDRRGGRPPGNGIPGGHEKILVVDDDQAVRESTARLLGELGYTVVTVDSGAAAVGYMESNGADLVLLDLRMESGTAGIDAYRRIRKLRPLQKAIVMTGYAGPAEVAAVRALGIAHYLIKPTPVTLLARSIREVMDRP